MLIMAQQPSICTDLWQVWQVLGWVLWVFKIVIPILIIVFGMLDLGKAVVASKDDEVKKAIKSLAMRAVAGIIIFFIPTLVATIFKIVDGFNEVRPDFNVCSTCITNPKACETKAAERCNSTDVEGSWDSASKSCV